MFFVFLGNLENAKSVGTNNLIKIGAKLVTSPKDIIEKYEFLKKSENLNRKVEIIPKEYKKIYDVLSEIPVDINSISKLSKVPMKEVMAKITMLELKGKVKKVAGNRYIRY